jgi:arabinofuranosyltransferase
MRLPLMRSKVSLWGPSLFLSALFGLLAWTHRWICDDGFIDFHVADNLLSGFGPVFNVGERVEAYTSPLWVALLALSGWALKPFSRDGLPPFEWIAVALGIASSVAAFAAASFGSDRLWRDRQGAGASIPVGGLVVLALAPFWDYGTSGLEASLVLVWLALSFAMMVCARDQRGWRLEILTSLWLGLGPLVRPDLGIFTLLFGAVFLLSRSGWRRRVMLLVTAMVLPLGYQVFRMGYFACLVPNTALAKEASRVAWGRGWRYFEDFEMPYQLWLPLVILVLAELAMLRRFWKDNDKRSAALAAAPALGGVLYGLYITRVGGDFLHARMLLPALFALALPVFMLPVRPGRWIALALAPWVLACVLFARARAEPESMGIERGRLDLVETLANKHPVTAADHREQDWATADGFLVRLDAAERSQANPAGARFYGSEILRSPLRPVELNAWLPSTIQAVVYRGAIGLFGFGGRQRLYLCDHYGLADAFAARAEMGDGDGTSGRGKAGHEKGLKEDWCLARTVAALDGRGSYSIEVGYLRSALGCGELAELQAAVTEPLTGSRFWSNFILAPRLTRFRIPHDALEARERFCQLPPQPPAA